MPFDSQGNFSRVHNWEQDRINGIKIVSDRHDAEDDNFASGFDLCLVRDGRAAMTGNLKMGDFQIKNVANGSSSTDAVNKSQLDAINTAQTTALNDFKNKFQVVSELPADPDVDTFYFITA